MMQKQKIIPAKFDSACGKCGGLIRKDMSVLWKIGSKAEHLDCEAFARYEREAADAKMSGQPEKPAEKHVLTDREKFEIYNDHKTWRVGPVRMAERFGVSPEEIERILLEMEPSKITAAEKLEICNQHKTWRPHAQEFVANNYGGRLTIEEFASIVLGVRTVPKPRP